MLIVFSRHIYRHLLIRTLELARSTCFMNHMQTLAWDDFFTWICAGFCTCLINEVQCVSFFSLFLKPLNTNTDNKRCLTIWCFSLIMWPFSLFCSVYLPCGMQDVKGWPTRSPMCLSRKATARRISERERGDRLSHPDAANLLPASHVNRYAIVWSTACLAWTEPQPRR